jgi:hypothetical protein
MSWLQIKKNNMENFFYKDWFYSNLSELALVLDINKENINELRDDWQVTVELADLEPIFEVNADLLYELLANTYEDRFPEEFYHEKGVMRAIKGAINFTKLNRTLPKLYYPNNNFVTVTKGDLLTLFKIKTL